MNSETEKILNDHKQMLITSGSLSDFQLKNLKMWPLILFDHDDFNICTVHYDFGQDNDVKNPGTVGYVFDFTKECEYNEEELEKKTQELTNWVRTMFWVDTKVSFAITKEGKKWMK